MEKYYKDYIDGVNIDNIEFKTYTWKELQEFFKTYYYDTDLEKAVYWEEYGFLSPYGMHYLEFDSSFKDLSYVLGIADNSKGGKTIVFSMEYDENYQVPSGKEKKISYFLFIETNYFFRNKGILKKALNYIKEIFKDNDIVVVSPESPTGSEISLHQRIVDLFEDTGVEVKRRKYIYSLVRIKNDRK